MTTLSSINSPLRQICMTISSPMPVACTRVNNWVALWIFWPLYESTTSHGCKPAACAGEPGETPKIAEPCSP